MGTRRLQNYFASTVVRNKLMIVPPNFRFGGRADDVSVSFVRQRRGASQRER